MSSGLTAKFALRANLAVSLDEGFGGLGTGAPVPRPPNPSSRLTTSTEDPSLGKRLAKMKPD